MAELTNIATGPKGHNFITSTDTCIPIVEEYWHTNLVSLRRLLVGTH